MSKYLSEHTWSDSYVVFHRIYTEKNELLAYIHTHTVSNDARVKSVRGRGEREGERKGQIDVPKQTESE